VHARRPTARQNCFGEDQIERSRHLEAVLRSGNHHDRPPEVLDQTGVVTGVLETLLGRVAVRRL